MEATSNKEKHKRKKKKSRIKMVFFLLFWMLIIGSFAALIVQQAGAYNDLHAYLLEIETQIARQIAINDDLSLQVLFFDSDVHVEQLARERLGMVRSYEIVFRNLAIGN